MKVQVNRNDHWALAGILAATDYLGFPLELRYRTAWIPFSSSWAQVIMMCEFTSLIHRVIFSLLWRDAF
jgi:hypothetical protein